MTQPGTATSDASVAPLDGATLRRVVAVLCVTEIVSWGVLFYAFPVLASTIAAVEAWPLANVMAAFTWAQLVAAAAGVWVGHRIDRDGPHAVMTVGSVLGVVAVAALALAPNQPAFFAAFTLVGLAMSATLYAPAFAAVTHWAGPERRVRALTAITLVAGLASTVFAPLTALLLSQLSWRGTYLALTLVLLTTALLHGAGLRGPWRPGHRVDGAGAAPAGDSPWRLLRDPTYATLVLAFTLAGFCVYAVVVNLIPMLTSSGLSTQQAAVALGVGGAGQVAGRLFYGRLLSGLPVRARTVGVLGAASVTTFALALSAGSMVAACIAAFAAGTARGVFTLVHATAVPDRWGTHAYGARTAVLTGGVMGASAFAPWFGALLATTVGGYTGAFILLAAGAALAMPLIRPNPPRA
jgi:MFS family permease